MKKILTLITICFTAFNVIAQELGEGDLYLQSEEYKNAQVVSESNYVVPHLFTNLAFEEVQEKAFNERKIYYVDFSAS
ncbi:MAG: hypothetical protein ACPGVH_08635, partial [Chitinophagales bacterium]